MEFVITVLYHMEGNRDKIRQGALYDHVPKLDREHYMTMYQN
jgi:hypothetical protein